MKLPQAADNQAVIARPGGEAIWITDIITPKNPDVMLLYDSLTHGVHTQIEKIISCWQYVASIPYKEIVNSKLIVQGKSYTEKDTWLYPAEVIRLAPVANCANKSFLLTSLLRNELSAESVRCALGHITFDGIGAHAWVCMDIPEGSFVLETTVDNLEKALLPLNRADAYDPIIYFNDEGVTTLSDSQILEEHFGFCAVKWLKEYICERCLSLNSPS